MPGAGIGQRCRSSSACGASPSSGDLAEGGAPPIFLPPEMQPRPGPTILTPPPRESRRLRQGRAPCSILHSRRDADILRDSLHQRHRRPATTAVPEIPIAVLKDLHSENQVHPNV